MTYNRPVVQHYHGNGIPPQGSLAPYEIGIGVDYVTTSIENEDGTISEETIPQLVLYTSLDGKSITQIGGSGGGEVYEVADYQFF